MYNLLFSKNIITNLEYFKLHYHFMGVYSIT